MDKKIEGWQTPINRGLMSYDELLGAPRFMLVFTLPLVCMAVLLPWSDLLAAAIIIQAIAVGITKLEPEWATILSDLRRLRGEYEP